MLYEKIQNYIVSNIKERNRSITIEGFKEFISDQRYSKLLCYFSFTLRICGNATYKFHCGHWQLCNVIVLFVLRYTDITPCPRLLAM